MWLPGLGAVGEQHQHQGQRDEALPAINAKIEDRVCVCSTRVCSMGFTGPTTLIGISDDYGTPDLATAMTKCLG